MNEFKRIRKALGLTQSEIGSKLTVTQMAINNYEHNNRTPRIVTAKMLVKLAATHNIETSLDKIYNDID